ncbi:response regulator [Pannus brasiliensis CCIBt3594]|uniref:Response regulator n=1 Tax=Pannus brasiliensis CCIBt3594 TaxID=1427578 RepID=A0AAW9QET7_9CHRO
MKILVVEDDRFVSMTVKHLLASRGHAVDTVADGRTGLEMVEAFEYDLILLDIRLPGLDGIALCQQIRSRGYRMPILMLTGIEDRQEKAIALNTGADDYVVKPFDSSELLARVHALLRRGKVAGAPVLEWENLRLDPNRRSVTYGGTLLTLTAKEYALLELLLREPRRVWSPAEIIERVWESDKPRGEESVRYHVKELRKKLQGVGAPFGLVETVYGVGYRMNARFSGSIEPGPGKPERPTVLLLTDSPALRDSIGRLLADRGIQAIAVDSVARYWQTLEKVKVSLVMINAGTAAIDALELGKTTRQTLRWRNLPMIALIPNTEPSLIERVFAVGFDDFVSQPILGPELVSRTLSRVR